MMGKQEIQSVWSLHLHILLSLCKYLQRGEISLDIGTWLDMDMHNVLSYLYLFSTNKQIKKAENVKIKEIKENISKCGDDSLQL